MGPYRVWLQCAWVPGLAMSRALGDTLAHRVGVSSVPDVTELDLTPRDRLLVLASDGVWEFVSSREAVEIAARCATAEEACRAVRGSAGVVCSAWFAVRVCLEWGEGAKPHSRRPPNPTQPNPQSVNPQPPTTILNKTDRRRGV